MENKTNTPLKFSLELDAHGHLTFEMQGSGMDIGQHLFVPFFTLMGFYGKAVAAGISAALQMSYPKETKKSTKKQYHHDATTRTAEV